MTSRHADFHHALESSRTRPLARPNFMRGEACAAPIDHRIRYPARGSIDGEQGSLEIARAAEVRPLRVIRRGAERLEQTHIAPRASCRLEQHAEERGRLERARTREGREEPARTDALESQRVEVAVALETFFHPRAIADD